MSIPGLSEKTCLFRLSPIQPQEWKQLSILYSAGVYLSYELWYVIERSLIVAAPECSPRVPGDGSVQNWRGDGDPRCPLVGCFFTLKLMF